MGGTHEHAVTVDPRRLPDPHEPVPAVAWPTVGLFAAGLALFGGSTALAVSGSLPWAIAVVLNTAASYMFFTVLHDACHRTTSQHDAVNVWLGRLSALFVAPPFASYSVFRYVHMQHHRFTNEDSSMDPDAYTSNGPRWTWPLRWATLDLRYYVYFFPLFSKRPLRDRIELVGTGAVSLGAIAALALPPANCKGIPVR